LRVEPAPAGFDSTRSEGSADRFGRCGGFAQMFFVHCDVDLICLHRQAFIARIAAVKFSTHIHLTAFTTLQVD
jgi:hypothetical protein